MPTRLPRAILLGSLLAVSLLLPARAVPTFDEVRQAHASSESLLLDRQGEALHRLRTNPQLRRGAWIALDDVSPALRSAMLISEDKRFYQHGGIDWRAVGAAAWSNLRNERTRGASTISMQLAGLIDADGLPGQRRSIVQKIGQAATAQWLDGRWRKDEILEAYLNLVPFRGELVGIDALSRTLFGKAAHGLDEREAAITAALVRAPNAAPQQVGQRACGILAQMRGSGTSEMLCDSLGLYATGVLLRRPWAPSDGAAPHLAQRLLADQPGGSTLRSTLSGPLQRQASTLLQRQLHELQTLNVRDGAVLVLDNASGDVLAWVGSSPDTSRSPQVDGVLARRQPGSTLKPFLYGQALAESRLTAASLLDDSPAAIPTQSGLYIPQNYDRHFKGWTSLRMALGNSYNVPAVRTVGMVGVNPFAQQLQQLGIRLDRTGDYYGYSLALGSPEMSLLELTNAYRALANGGRWAPVRTRLDEAIPATAQRQALDARASFIIGDILSDNHARLTTFGINSVLRTRFWSAVKTGTSKDMRDNWAIGWSEHYTVGVWIGNAEGDAMWDVSGTSGAAPIWAELMQALHAELPSHAPTPPRGVVRQPVRFGPGPDGQPLEAARSEWFVAGSQQALFALPDQPAARQLPPRIDSPVDGTILALDPDIPPQRQRLQLRTRAAQAQWWIDGKQVGQGQQAGWLPWPGRHQIQLRQPDGRLIDQVQIEVRGAGVVAQHR